MSSHHQARCANRRSACKGSRIPRVDLKQWKEDEDTAKPTLFSAAPTLYSVLSLSSSQNEFGLNNLPTLNKIANVSSTKYSPLTFLQEKIHFDQSSSAPLQTEELDKNFEEWVKNKELAQNLAAINPHKSSSTINSDDSEDVFLNEVPKPITSEQYFSVFKSDKNNMETNDENDITFDFTMQGRSSKIKYEFAGNKKRTGNHNFDVFVDDLFKSARKKAFNDKLLFY